MTPPNGLTAIKECYGWIKIERDPINGGWRIYDPIGWEAVNMTLLPELPGLPGRRLYVNKKIVDPLAIALTSVAGLNYRIQSIACFSPRPKKNPNELDQLSLHSWGVAIDINPSSNPAQTITDDSQLRTDMPPEFIEAFENVGFLWGGHFKGAFKDPMHFQYAVGY